MVYNISTLFEKKSIIVLQAFFFFIYFFQKRHSISSQISPHGYLQIFIKLTNSLMHFTTTKLHVFLKQDDCSWSVPFLWGSGFLTGRKWLPSQTISITQLSWTFVTQSICLSWTTVNLFCLYHDFHNPSYTHSTEEHLSFKHCIYQLSYWQSFQI